MMLTSVLMLILAVPFVTMVMADDPGYQQLPELEVEEAGIRRFYKQVMLLLQ